MPLVASFDISANALGPWGGRVGWEGGVGGVGCGVCEVRGVGRVVWEVEKVVKWSGRNIVAGSGSGDGGAKM